MSEHAGFVVHQDRAAYAKSASHPDDRSKLRQEFEILTAIAAPGVVAPVELIEDLNATTLVTSLGGRHNLKSWKTSSLLAFANVTISAIDALGEVHQMGWSHGNPAAGHCLVGEQHKVRLCSLRLATPLTPAEHHRSEGAVVLSGERAMSRDFATLGSALRHSWSVNEAALTAERGRARSMLAAAIQHTIEELESGPTPNRALGIRASLAQVVTPRREDGARATPQPGRTVTIILRGLLLASALSALLVFLAARPPSSGLTLVGLIGRGEIVASATELSRWMAMASAAYLILAVWLGTLSGIWRREGLQRIAKHFAPTAVRRWLLAIGGIGALAVTTEPSISVPAAPTSAPTTSAPTTSAFTASSTIAPDTTTPSSTTSTQVVEPAVKAPVDASAHNESSPVQRTWTVDRGDHLWSIAEETLQIRNGETPSTQQVDSYWRRIIEQNRDRLVDPDNPDLIHRGQILLLPD